MDANFTLPAAGDKYVPPAGQNLRDHIDGLWPVLTRTTSSAGQYDSLLPLPKPYVVPGGRFREVYYSPAAGRVKLASTKRLRSKLRCFFCICQSARIEAGSNFGTASAKVF